MERNLHLAPYRRFLQARGRHALMLTSCKLVAFIPLKPVEGLQRKEVMASLGFLLLMEVIQLLP